MRERGFPARERRKKYQALVAKSRDGFATMERNLEFYKSFLEKEVEEV